MKNLPILCLAALFFCNAHAQLTVDPGSSLTFQNGTQFHVDGITLIPSADFILGNVVLGKSATAVHTPVNTYISRVYQFSNTSDAFSGSVQINYTDGLELNGIPETALTLNIYNGTNWAPYPASTRDASNNYVLTNGLSGITLNELTLADLSAPLPITLVDFSGYLQDHIVHLKWTTASESNNDHFEIERSADGRQFHLIGNVKGNGTTSIPHNYTLRDDHPLSGKNYYRIKQVDIDGGFSYSSVIWVNNAGVSSFSASITPNPAGSVMNLVIEGVTEKENLVFEVMNTNGMIVYRENISAAGTTMVKSLPRPAISAGLYFYKIARSSNNETLSGKLVMQ